MIPERTPLLLETQKLAFKGGVLNRHTPGSGAWLPKRLRPKHKDGHYRRGPVGKLKPRPGDPLRDEPLRHNPEKVGPHRHKRLHSDTTLDLERTELLLDHDKHT